MNGALLQAVSVAANKPDLVLVHGWGMDSSVFAPLVAELAADFEKMIQAIVLPGSGGGVPTSGT